MNLPIDNDTNPLQGAVTGPGKRLRDARVAKNLRQQDVAAHLNLEVATIEALEHDDYSALPASAYVRGYLRNYARFVGQPVDEVVRAFDHFGLSEDPPPLPKQVRHNSPLRVSDRRVRWITYMVVLVLATLFFVWWRNEATLDFTGTEPPGVVPEIEEFRGTPATVDEADDGAVTEPAPVDEPIEQAPPDVAEIEWAHARASEALETGLAASAEASEPLEVAALELGTDPDRAGETEARILGGAPAPSGNDASATADPADALAALETAPDALERSGPALAPEAYATVELRFDEASWVEVYDAEGERLLYELAQEDTRRSVVGRKPLEVFLGNAPAVDLRLDGDPFDARPYTRTNNTARFTLGEPLEATP